MTPLEEVRAAVAARTLADQELRRKVRAADDAGEQRADIAAEAGVTRQTIYRWLAEDGGGLPYANPVDAMNEALLVLLELGSGPAHEIGRGLQIGVRSESDRKAKARRVLLGAGNLPGSAQTMGIPEEQRAVLNAGVLAAQRILGPKGVS